MDFTGFTPKQFLETCVLSGCDYVDSVAGIGLKKAHSMMKRHKSIFKAIRMMRFEGCAVPAGYEDAVRCAEFQM